MPGHADEAGGRFRRVRRRGGYDVEAVDRFFETIQDRSADEIDQVEFPSHVLGSGYDVDEVDDALDARAAEVRRTSPASEGPDGFPVDEDVVIHRRGTLVFSWILVALSIGFSVLLMVGGVDLSDRLASVIGAGTSVATWHALLRPGLVIGPTRIVMRQIGYDRVITWPEFVRARGVRGEGLEIVHASGTRYPSSAFPSSVAGMISGDQAMARALELMPPNPRPVLGAEPVQRRWRLNLPLVIGAPALAVIGSLIAEAIRG